MVSLRTSNGENTYSAGGLIGIFGGKGRISGHAHIGLMTAYEKGLGFEVSPQIGVGIRVRLFKK